LPPEIEPIAGEGIVVASQRLLRDFERGIVEGTSPTPNFEDGLRAQLMLDGARESARTGQLVPLEGDS
jgi:predicted dehydrogenase